jgi:hypothetical protein
VTIPPVNMDALKNLIPVVQAIRLYHRHEVVGIDHVPSEGPALVVANHSLATYDISLLMAAIYLETKRVPRPLIDRLFFKIPGLGDLMEFLGAVQGSQESARTLLKKDNIVTVAPGGMREALRPSSERYQIRWERRTGFAKLAMATGAPIILAACPKADDLYEIYPNPVTSWAYKTFRVPLFLARGVGPTPLPRPVKLVHFLSEPITPPRVPEGADEAEGERIAKDFHAQIVTRMHELIAEAVRWRG